MVRFYARRTLAPYHLITQQKAGKILVLTVMSAIPPKADLR
jgi:hypothetical protein